MSWWRDFIVNTGMVLSLIALAVVATMKLIEAVSHFAVVRCI